MVVQIVHRLQMPKPTAADPWAQMDWLFDRRAAMAKSEDARDNFLAGRRYMRLFLASEATDEVKENGYVIDREVNEYILLRFKTFVEDQSLSSSYVAGILSAARQTFTAAISNNWISLKEFIDYSLPPQSRETDARAPYTDDEMTAILKALDEDIQFSRGLLKPYRRSGVGSPLEKQPTSSGELRAPRGWWSSEDNLKWYFENALNSIPITGEEAQTKARHDAFLAAARRHGGLHELYRRWGVSAWIGPEVVLPYAYRLEAETGLNPSVLLALRVSDYHQEHPLTGRPFIRYWKERGSGESDLHVDLLQSGVLPLDEAQSRQVARIWDDVLRLTAKFRADLPKESREFLFVYQSRSVKSPGAARDFLTDAKTTGSWATKFVERHGLKDKEGRPISLTLARFRPSLVSRLLRRGVDIMTIKSILGQRSVLTTIRYINSYDFMPHARREVRRAIEQIRANTRTHNADPKPVASETDFRDGEVVFTTGLALCKNVFRPPENIRKAAGIGVGSPCTIFNMCIRCQNVIILEEHLPRIFAMRREYVQALEQGLSQSPNRASITQSLCVLDDIVDPERSEWSAEVLNIAEKLSELIVDVDDPLVARGVGL